MTEQTFFAAMAVGISPLVTLQLEFETCCSCVRQIAKEGAVACCACCDFLNGGVASAKQFPLPLRLFAGLVHIGNADIGEISKVALQYRHITGKASQSASPWTPELREDVLSQNGAFPSLPPQLSLQELLASWHSQRRLRLRSGRSAATH